jgi:glycosyltransferase involved in cell wall biosynthesis
LAEKPRLIWHSNSPFCSTGYGQQTALVLPRLAGHYKLVCSAFYGVEGNAIAWNDITVLPGIGGTYGNETIAQHAHMFFKGDPRGGLIVTLMDCWVLEPAIWERFNVASWVPVDHEPCPDPVHRFFRQTGAVPICMSRFGQEQMQDLDPLYCPHAVETDILKPYPKDEAREEVGLPKDEFIVGMVAANKGNPSRKCFAEAFEAFAAFHKKHPDSRLYLHTEISGRFQGVNLEALLHATGVPIDKVSFADQYRQVFMPVKPETLAKLYSSMDVLLAPSAGEGFGIPVIEAQSCGVPVIVSDFSAQPELVGSGWMVEGVKTYTAIGSYQFKPSVPDIAHALDEAYLHASTEGIAKRAREKALEYDIETVMTDHMLPSLEAAQERYEARKPTKLRVAA